MAGRFADAHILAVTAIEPFEGGTLECQERYLGLACKAFQFECIGLLFIRPHKHKRLLLAGP